MGSAAPRLLLSLLALGGASACGSADGEDPAAPVNASPATEANPADAPAAAPPQTRKRSAVVRELEPGVVRREYVQAHQRVWLYLPGETPPRGLVVVPPAGGTGFTAAELTEGDKPEHVPYVKAGYAVLSFNMRGTLPPRAKRPQAEAAARGFVEGEGGLQDAVTALDLAVDELGDQLPAKRIFAAGHSSAASLVLALATREPRVQAVLAYAPVADFSSWIQDKPMSQIVEAVEGARELAHRQAPIRLVSSIRQPVFLFHAVDDPVVAVSESQRLATAFAGAGNRAKLVTVPTGGHYDAMVNAGIPAGIKWLATFD